jgi:PilZ domain
MSTEKRKSARLKSFLRGFVRTIDNGSTIDCLVRDISKTGAKLKFRCKPSITDALELHIPATRQVFRSKVVWNEDSEVGISFDSIVDVDIPSAHDGDLVARAARLEQEIAALKRALSHLQAPRQTHRTTVRGLSDGEFDAADGAMSDQ